MATSGHQRSSVVISIHQWASPEETCVHGHHCRLITTLGDPVHLHRAPLPADDVYLDAAIAAVAAIAAGIAVIAANPHPRQLTPCAVRQVAMRVTSEHPEWHPPADSAERLTDL